MNDNPLSQLHSIHTPDTVNAWPLAWGWWLLLALIVLLVSGLVYYGYRKIRFNRAKRQAIKTVNRLDIHSNHVASQLNQVLKRFCIHYGTASTVAKISGETWIAYLLRVVDTRTADKVRNDLVAMQTLLYTEKSATSAQNAQFQQAVLTWIKKADMSALATSNPVGSSKRV
ncbi:DUF4381 domain-containing protein [Aestuariibacter sp. A3R04]|uniref:DUF4381 domain-containing protein n=1 Tax=Aestuariibacter sp. A3R04 TaxID=2841571 RepID=UPI001C0A2B5D|nr:DUF4381 domain-containing protein [Aestuariibacter sp. A3R04]MBU3022398.1 DUF4381 domain-containing protein [Aestuariibacter sp. A3R04]